MEGVLTWAKALLVAGSVSLPGKLSDTHELPPSIEKFPARPLPVVWTSTIFCELFGSIITCGLKPLPAVLGLLTTGGGSTDGSVRSSRASSSNRMDGAFAGRALREKDLK